MGSSDPEDEEVETDEVKAKQLADQEVCKIWNLYKQFGKAYTRKKILFWENLELCFAKFLY